MPWVDCGTYYVSSDPQGSKGWHEIRNSGILTGSIVGSAIGWSNPDFGDPDSVANDMSGIKKKVFTQTQLDNMKHGTDNEGNARNWYTNMKGVTVEEIGIAIPKWDKRIGASVDGNVLNSNKIIEIKCPKSMYKPLNVYLENISNGWKPPPSWYDPESPLYYNHIWKSHLAQMYWCMKIMGKTECDYIVYCIPEGKVFLETIYFNEIFWNKLYSLADKFITEKLDPLLRQQNITRIDPSP